MEFPLISCLPIVLFVGAILSEEWSQHFLWWHYLVGIPVVLWLSVVLSCLGSYDFSFTPPLDYLLCPRNLKKRTPNESVIMVIGGSRGLGRALVAYLIDRGYYVIATVRKPEDARSLVDEFGAERVLPTILELTDDKSIERACNAITILFGQAAAGNNAFFEQQDFFKPHYELAAVVAVAGITSMGPFEGIPFDKLRRLIETNVLGTMHVIHALMPLIRTHKARIVVTGAPDVPLPQYVMKSTCNGALLAFCRALRTDLWGLGVSVSLVQPAATRGGMVIHGPELIRTTRQQMSQDLREIYPPGFRLLRAAKSDFGFHPDWALWAFEHAIASKRPKTRYCTTPTGTVLYFASFLLPDRLLEMMLFKGPLGPGGETDDFVSNDTTSAAKKGS